MVTVDEEEQLVIEVSEWALEQIEEVSWVLGPCFEGMEQESWAFFVALQKEQQGFVTGKQKKGRDSRGKIPRELKNLRCGISCEKGEDTGLFSMLAIWSVGDILILWEME